MLGLGLSIPQVAARGSRSLVAAIRSLFAANEPGVWYDPSDLSTLFQDAQGTTPVTAVEQPVGLMLDKSEGLVLGPELVTNGGFDTDTAWTKGTGWTISGGRATRTNVAAISGLSQTVVATQGKFYQIAIEVVVTGGSIIGIRLGTTSQITTTITASGTYTYRVTCDGTNNTLNIVAQTNFSGTIDNISVRELPGNHAYQTTATSRPVLSARVNQYLATETLTTQNVTTLAAYYRLRFEGTGTITLSGTATGVYSAGLHLIPCTAGTLTSTVSGSVTKADLRVANAGVNLPPYQRVNTATDYDTTGFPHYLRFDGVDDWLVTNTITPGTDKAQVFAGVRKLSDAALGCIVSLSASAATTGAFTLDARRYAVGDYALTIRNHSANSFQNFLNYPAPITNTLTAIYNQSGANIDDELSLRVNGALSAKGAVSAFNAGYANFASAPIYLGRLGGTSAPFNGHLYGLIVRFGSTLPIETIEQAEAWINGKTGAY